ncbi:MAG: LON peptidase substrate-binding domain-containing protein [Thalassobaculum sp.]|uniref:LON peptidase substrate-binding domain-containing protein n=1 Tax=Thalassobaculum sp. TaxID=2022740 RepID=UPI0032EE0B89
MTDDPFGTRYEDLPATLPVFPLTGVLLLPRGKLPLNIFEPRYLAMTRDALGAGRLIGMIQPRLADDPAEVPALYEIGCAGRITQFAETDDGRYLITLTGVCRFAITEEVASMRGYRRAQVDWSRFRQDLDEPTGVSLDREGLVERLQRYFDGRGIQADWNSIRSTSDERLVTTLAMVCPFEPGEKQGLLECPSLEDRSALLMALIEMAAAGGDKGDDHVRH